MSFQDPTAGDQFVRIGHVGFETLVDVYKTEDADVEFCPASGGFTRKMKASDFLAAFRYVTPTESHTWSTIYRAAEFTGEWVSEATKPLHGYTNGATWNGWATPFLTREVVELAIASNYGFLAESFYNDKSDEFYLITNESMDSVPSGLTRDEIIKLRSNDEYSFDAEGECYNVQVISAEDILVDGLEIAVFAVGMGFCWQEVSLEPDQSFERSI